ncbi:tetratricopeptide repeat protein [Limnoglobus roseus]|uniref:Tetratricopeptide repeat protein n=1 Tax=Limnoglobus roseus TaxID=2598579 RepID=A0A5C1ACA4_9BACT|nr:tetratricopeptide repeat protein [Limnoglobus roseus]QEL14724.1 tetratricopeptide repeat protein [Limnoglobus roseus]
MSDAQALFERGFTALEADDFVEAVESLTRAIALDPRVAAGYRYRAKAYLALGDRPKAIADLDAALRLKPHEPQVLAERAAELLKQRRYADAIADCDTALRLDPGRVDLFAVRGHCHARLGESAAAFADYEAGIRADPERAAEYLVQRALLHLDCGNPQATLDDADTALRLDEDDGSAYEVRARAYFTLRQYASAAADFAVAAARDPLATSPRIGRLYALEQMQDWPAVIAAADELLARSPTMEQVLERRGRAYLAMGRPADAIADFDAIVQKRPRRMMGYFLRGTALEAAGDEAAAVRDFLQALECEPADAGTLNQLAWVWATSQKADVRNPVQAKELATRACELTDWLQAGFLDTLAVACAALGDTPAAAAWMEKAIELDDREEYRERLKQFRPPA